jgi:hypothetical protein
MLSDQGRTLLRPIGDAAAPAWPDLSNPLAPEAELLKYGPYKFQMNRVVSVNEVEIRGGVGAAIGQAA